VIYVFILPQHDIPNPRWVVYVGRGFCILDADFDAISEEVKEIWRLNGLKKRPIDRISTSATRLAQLFKSALFPAETASYGYYDGKVRDGDFHMERYQIIEGVYSSCL
jgi:hypothetical protein